ncbi:MAG: FAD-binding protein [Actinobacteria bacterium]|uniref:Cholesterol oxidase n=2 Tax=freshwater metagenome TaxID=449393 RepID=A0A6J7HG55_9ZZZZ|nr:FAD-binding protein [Actinomycetota bacterium]MSX24222.1 FAD-binding protein [Actinomycetota bacterium]MSY56719.1 FAD-binding protein [Actinomycetota bacterium]MTB00356.1 FAD-binding protein [Actinomycetota bacterium]
MKPDYDVVIIGSGFGGSVSALRLVEKGYKVAVLEAGRRFADSDFPKTSWRLRKFLFAPKLGLFGIQRIHVLPDVLVLAGAGVGGGSLVYANTLYQPGDEYFNDEHWRDITDWKSELEPWYDQARRMLGVTINPYYSPSDKAMQEAAEAMGVGHTFTMAPLGIHFGKSPGEKVADPFFGGVGPDREGCMQCGGCMTGCRHNAKNTLPKNYLGLAEKFGAKVFPLTTVETIEELADGSWKVSAKRTGPFATRTKVFTARQVIVAAGTFNTQKLLHRLKATGKLSRLSNQLGELSRTNSESLVGAIMPNTDIDFSTGSAITSSFYPDEHTHVEPVRYGKGSNAMGLLQTIMTDGSSAKDRRRQWISMVIRKPSLLPQFFNVRKWSERTVIALVMQNVNSSISVKVKRGILGWRLTSTNDSEHPNATWIPAANETVRKIAQNYGGIAGGNIGDLINAPFTAHFVGGCVIGSSEKEGVIDPYHRVWNYPTLHIVDGSTITANLGVNPSLTITAQAERALSMWPNLGDEDLRPTQGGNYKKVAQVVPRSPVVPANAPAFLRVAPPTK